MRRSSGWFVAVAVAAGVVLSACSSPDRMAAPVEEEMIVSEQTGESGEEARFDAEVAGSDDQAASEASSPSELTSPSTAPMPPVSEGSGPDEAITRASLRGVRVCVVNNRTTRLDSLGRSQPANIEVDFTKANDATRGKSTVIPGSTVCGERAFSSDSYDVEGFIATKFDNTPLIKFKGYNQRIGFPDMPVFIGSWLGQPDSPPYDDGENQVAIKREADSPAFIEFLITVSDSTAARG